MKNCRCKIAPVAAESPLRAADALVVEQGCSGRGLAAENGTAGAMENCRLAPIKIKKYETET